LKFYDDNLEGALRCRIIWLGLRSVVIC